MSEWIIQAAGGWLLLAIGAQYLVIAAAYAAQRQPWMSMVFTAYAVANVGFYYHAK